MTMKNEVEPNFVPLLIGSGRLARHLSHYFSLRGIPHLRWITPRSPIPESLARQATHFWVLVSDHALGLICQTLTETYPGTPLLHSSAATPIPNALTLHPLMTFGPKLYSLSHYESIPFFMIQEESVRFPDFLLYLRSILKHEVHLIAAQDRARYHASAVMMSNDSMILWEAALNASGLIPRHAFEPILKQSLENFMSEGIDALTGPLKRKDGVTIHSHIKALSGTPEGELYQAFVRYFETTRKEPLHHDLSP